MGVGTLFIGPEGLEIEYKYLSMSFIKTHPSVEPDEWEAEIDADYDAINYNDSVIIKRDGTAIFKGYVDTIEPRFSNEGRILHISGPCWKGTMARQLLDQKMYGIGTSDIEKSFFYHCKPWEILRFLIQNPQNDSPREEIDGTCMYQGEGEGIYKDGSAPVGGTSCFGRTINWEITVGGGATSGSSVCYMVDRDDNTNWWSNENQTIGMYVQICLKHGEFPLCGIRVENRAEAGDANYDEYMRDYKIEISKRGDFAGEQYEVAGVGSNSARCVIHGWSPKICADLNYDNQTGNFTVGETVTGQTSGATATIHYDKDDGTTGTLTLKNIQGTFQDNETITDPLGGSALVNGNIDYNKKYVRITLMANYAVKWAITQIYIYYSEGGPYLNRIPLTEGTGPTYSASIIRPTNLDYMNIADAFQEIINLMHTNYSVWEWWVDTVNKTWNLAPRRGTDKSGTIEFKYDPTHEDSHFLDIERTKGSRGIINRIKVIGGGAGGDIEEELVTSDWHQDTTSISNYGLYMGIENEPAIDNKAMADEWAKIMLNEYKNLRSEIRVIVHDKYASNAWDVGDEITLTDTHTGVSGKYRVMQVKREYSGDGEIVTIVASDASTYLPKFFPEEAVEQVEARIGFAGGKYRRKKFSVRPQGAGRR